MTGYRFETGSSVSASDGAKVLRLGDDVITGLGDFEARFGDSTSLERDLLTIAAAVFAADRGTERPQRELLSRRIRIEVPVVNAGRLGALTSDLERILRNLSSDSWEICLYQVAGVPEVEFPSLELAGRTLLFSGGLDSLAAAFRLHGEGIDLVSHVTRNQQTVSAQRSLVSELAARGVTVPHTQYFVSSRSTPHFNHSVETSQRTRSFVFLVLAALCARRSGHHELVYLAENGQMAIHLPLTQGRIGAFSTHTAHPDVLVAMEAFLQAVLGIPIRVVNPFVHETKAEVIQALVPQHSDLIWTAESCWKNARLPSGTSHCGECIPCFVRRIAIEHWLNKDSTGYARDLFSENVQALPADDVGRRNMVDLLEFVRQLDRLSNDEIMVLWPELYSANIEADHVISMYRRFGFEAKGVIARYASWNGLLE